MEKTDASQTISYNVHGRVTARLHGCDREAQRFRERPHPVGRLDDRTDHELIGRWFEEIVHAISNESTGIQNWLVQAESVPIV